MKKIIISFVFLVAVGIIGVWSYQNTKKTNQESINESNSQPVSVEAIVPVTEAAPVAISPESEKGNSTSIKEITPVIQSSSIVSSPVVPPSEDLVYITGNGIKIHYPSVYSYTRNYVPTKIGPAEEIINFGFEGNTEKISLYPSKIRASSCYEGVKNSSYTVQTISGQEVYHVINLKGEETFCLQNSEYYFQLTRKNSNSIKIDVSKIEFTNNALPMVASAVSTYPTHTYRNTEHDFSIKYPERFSYSEKVVGQNTKQVSIGIKNLDGNVIDARAGVIVIYNDGGSSSTRTAFRNQASETTAVQIGENKFYRGSQAGGALFIEKPTYFVVFSSYATRSSNDYMDLSTLIFN